MKNFESFVYLGHLVDIAMSTWYIDRFFFLQNSEYMKQIGKVADMSNDYKKNPPQTKVHVNKLKWRLQVSIAHHVPRLLLTISIFKLIWWIKSSTLIWFGDYAHLHSFINLTSVNDGGCFLSLSFLCLCLLLMLVIRFFFVYFFMLNVFAQCAPVVHSIVSSNSKTVNEINKLTTKAKH